jgi:manganese-dependent inorganic pyrophosphatase
MEKAMADHGIPMLFFMLTNILQGTTQLLYAGTGARELALESFHLPKDTEEILLENTVSRKKQIIPAMMQALQK